jgi:hypothetical protein
MTIIVAVALAALFLLTGATKMLRVPASVAARDELGVPAAAWSLLGAAEVAGAAGVLVGLSVQALGIAAAIGLVLVGLGGLVAHRRAQDPRAKAVPAVVAVLLATATLILFSTGR